MLTPGATMSGLSISGVTKLGPLDENAATTGDGLIPNLVPSKDKVAVGCGLVRKYRLMAFPAVSPTEVAGRSVGQDHSYATSFFHHLTLFHPRIHASVAEYNLPGNSMRIKRARQAQRARCRATDIVAHVDNRILLIKGENAPTSVEGDAGEYPAVAQFHNRREISVHSAGAYGCDPWGDIG
ncbi:hypothetical protein EJ110_NYTH40382 [Nymphaea thermarum]|nr:hypothetical protein EJ110_NYTH40382 [Nymphaea thermarum]